MKNNITYINKQRLASLALAGSLSFTLCGCSSTELGSDRSNIDTIDTNEENLIEGENQELARGLTKSYDVNGEDFKLEISYICEDAIDWRVTSTKTLYMSIKTKGLPENKEVYIDNIHTDTSICSSKAIFDGILQDTMDDRIHNSLMLGFPIDDTTNYFGCNIIEGQNSEFLEGWTYGYNGHTNGSVETRRRLESDFLEKGVNANIIDSVIDLIVIDKKNDTKRAISVYSVIKVRVNNKITFQEKDKLVTYEYDIFGKKTKTSEVPVESNTRSRNK